MIKMSENTFQMIAKYGPIVLGLCLLLNIWTGLRYLEIYRDAIKSEVQLQQMVNGQQIAESVVQEFATRVNTDPHIAEIFKQERALAQQQNPSPVFAR